jgi:hypothetical protein
VRAYVIAQVLRANIVATVDAYLHPTSTAPMGADSDPSAVVDAWGKVWGVDALRVVDASILPDIPSVPANVTTIMVAERIATVQPDPPSGSQAQGKSMVESAADHPHLPIKTFVLVAVAAMLCVGFDAQAPTGRAAAQDAIPALASSGFGWQPFGADWRDPPAGLRGPIKSHPKYPYHGNNDGPGQVTARIGNDTDPILKPWAVLQMRESNEEVLSGKRGEGFMAQSSRYPGGVPGQLLYPAEPIYFIQKPTQVWMIWQRDHLVRRIYLTDKHSPNLKLSWFGESIGRYESGDTLVVDTIGLSTRNSYIDNWRTPHSEQLHVIERFKLSADRRSLEALVKVEDPEAFNEPLFMKQMWRKMANPMLETVCAENNVDFFNQNMFPIPQAEEPDF